MKSVIILLWGMLFWFASAHSQNRDVAEKLPVTTREITPDQVQLETNIFSQIHATNLSEIEAGELAQAKGIAKEVRRYGDQLARDHRDADRRLLNFANRNNIVINLITDADGEKTKTKLQQANGNDFDKIFLTSMEDAHTKSIAYLEQAKSDLNLTETRNFISRMIPILKQHQDLAEKVDNKIVSQTKGKR